MSAAPTDLATFDSLNPASGEVIGSFPIHTGAEVDAAVAAARAAALWWGGLGFDGRERRLRNWARVITVRMDELATVIHQENGKPLTDARLEVVGVIEHLHWAATHAAAVLGRRTVGRSWLFPNQKPSVGYRPYGVVGVIGPWNYPAFTPMGSIAYALAAGNAVVFKPSEYTPSVGRWLVRSFEQTVPEHPVLQLVTGFGDTGAVLCTAGVGKLAFTGSTATAKSVMAACARTLTPVLLECGSKDALIVAEDADLAAAAQAAVWGGMSNAGQTCVGVERVYAVDAIYDEFVSRLTAEAHKPRPGSDRAADYGPITMPDQLTIISSHIDDALEHGATAIVGGRAGVHPPYVDPTILVNTPEDRPAVTDETFGPTLTVSRVRDTDEAIERANGTAYGLSSAVFSRRRGMEIAGHLRAGMTSINSVITFAVIPSLPFGGVGASGFGRIHGADGLREFSWPHAIVDQQVPGPLILQSFGRSAILTRALLSAVRLRYGRRGRAASRLKD
ncbi:MAG: aldehyde dehydrogenase family protein [Geodermatophilaceae bacterium]|nr:aldehyde dehydrogenase family protein [Geodermatophilaceae bacterium]